MTTTNTDARCAIRGAIATAAAFAALLVLPHAARAGYGVQPNGQSFPVASTSFGTIATPATIDFVVYLDELDRDPYVWISESPQMDGYGLPVGPGVGSCSPSDLTPFGEPGKWVCRESTILMQPGRTYYWWLDFRRLDTDNYSGQQRISGPFSFTLVPQAPDPSPVVPAPEVDTTTAVSTRTVYSAATLPAFPYYDGTSVKHTGLTSLVYRTMKRLGSPRTLAIACWSGGDWPSVLAAEGDEPTHGDSILLGFWKPSQPRWLHLAPRTCDGVQPLLDDGAPTGRRAGALVTVLHEALHAYGVRNEARTNCYAVQLVPVAGWGLGMSDARADYLGTLALRYVRSRAPSGYWNAARCRDGGAWDLVRDRTNLR